MESSSSSRLRPDDLPAPPSAATPRTPLSLAGAASPFDNFLNAYVPKEHEIAARQAAYNAAALASLAALACGAYLVAFILEPFLVPIFWAVLTGFLLHPYQAAVSRAAKRWLRRAAAASRPLTITVVSDLLGGAVLMCDGLGCHLLQLWRTLLAVALVAAGLLAMATANQNAVLLFYDVLTTVESACQSMAVLDASQWFFTLLAATVGAVGLAFAMPKTVGSHRRAILKALSCFFWFSAAGYIVSRFLATAAILLGAPLTFYVLMAARRHEPDENKVGQAEDRRRKISAPLAVFATTVLTSLVPKELHSAVEDAKGHNPEVQVRETPATPMAAGGEDSILQSAGGSEASAVLEETPARRPAKGLFADHRRQVLIRNSNLSRSLSRARAQGATGRIDGGRKSEEEEEEAPPSSNAILRVTLTLCVLMQFYLHPRLLHLLPVPAAAFILRRLWLLASLGQRVDNGFAALSEAVAAGGRGQVLLPAPVRTVYRLVVGAESRFLAAVPAYVDQMVAAALILAGITILAGVSLFLSLELYAEGLHITRGAGALLVGVANSSAFQHLNSSLHDHPGYRDGFDGVLESAYHYGRDFISSTVQTYLDDISNSTAAGEMTEKLLLLWDRLYQYWLSRRKDSYGLGPTVTDGAVASSLEDLFERLTLEQWKWDSIYSYCRENMGTLVGVLDQGWVVLKGNLGLLLNVLLEMVKLLLLSGSGVVNFALSVIVYLTALFYLLAASGRVYKPAEIMAKHGKVLGEGFASAADRAVTGVFLLTFKMAAFYGLWTYLTHTFFGVSIVVIPMLAAAFLAAVPFVGQYFAALPAALELWLGEDLPVQALLLLALHVLPSYVVDPLIYSEVRQGGMHPWLTALSVVGGIYYFGGVTGAICGPLVLCAVFVALSLFPSLASFYDSAAAASVTKIKSAHVSTPFVQRSESVC